MVKLQNLILTLTIFMLIVQAADPIYMEFKSTVNHKWLFTDSDANLISGYGGPNELQNKCTAFVGFYSEFEVDYTLFNVSHE